MIKLEHIEKYFDTSKGKVHAVKDVSLNIKQGEIFGVIGFSGAGKSTIVRCINLLEKYSTEKKSLSAEYEVILEREKADKQDEADVDEFMSRLRKYAGATELTREMCLDLIGYVTVDENTGRTKPRKIHIYYKFLDKELADKHNALA